MGMTVKEAILTLNANIVFACGRAGFSSATVKMIEDALDTIEDALKAQEPRVMTLEEVADWHKRPESEREPIYVEYLPNSGLGISRWTIEYFGFNPNLYPNKNSGYYGKWLRCWTSRPTDKQREATPWGP